jgi:two-component system, cell cycle sensor histidine kinase and response regulator CckA
MMDQRFILLGHIAAGVAHDLNNYLAIVELAVTALERGTPSGWGRSQLCEARAAVQGAKRLTNGLLDYARGGSPAVQRIDLPALIDGVLALFRRVIPENVVVEVHAGVEPLYVHGVAAELEQLVLNVVLNACDAMPQGGVLSLSVRACGERGITFEAVDTGSGLPDQAVSASGPTSPSSKRGGDSTGLGLGIVRSVVERHGARLEIGPRCGGGTRIVVSFASDGKAA